MKQALPDLNLLLISSAIEFWFVKVVPKYLNYSTLSKVLLLNLTVNSSCILISRHEHILSFISTYLLVDYYL